MKKTKLIIVLLSLLFFSAIIPKNLLQTKADASTRSDYVLVTKLASNTNKTDTIYEIYADSAHYDASNKILHDGASIKIVYTGQVGAYHIRLSVSNLWSAEFISTSPYQSKIFTLKLSKQTNKAVPLNLEINDSQDIYSDQGVITVGDQLRTLLRLMTALVIGLRRRKIPLAKLRRVIINICVIPLEMPTGL